MEKLRCYLIGSIQDMRDGGVAWRDKLAKDLEEMGFDVQDPTKMECNTTLAPSIEEQKKKLENLKRAGEWERWDATMEKIQQTDIVCVNNSKFVIVLYDPDKKLGGTIEEVVEAHHKGIPIYVVSYAPYIEFNDWILARFRQNFKSGGKIFPNFKQLTDFIEEAHKEYIKSYKESLRDQAKLQETKDKEPESNESNKKEL